MKRENKSRRVKKIINNKEHLFKKNLGQNFLFDKNLLEAIANDGKVCDKDVVLEIGAGAGTLTEILSNKAKKVISFEIDESLIEILTKKFESKNNVEFYFQDFMKCNIDELEFKKAKVVANIPYYITTPIVFKLVDKIEKFDLILILVQYEVASRFTSKEGTKDYGITSVILQSIFDVEMTRVVKRECFTPSPKVDSAVCKLIPHKKYDIENFDKFKDFVHLAFSMRRKTLVNNLKSKHDKDLILSCLNRLELNESVRPEEISVENFVKFYKMLNI